MNKSGNILPQMNPFRGGFIPLVRLFAIPLFAMFLIVIIRNVSSDEAWRRNVLGISFICYYVAVCLVGMLHASSSVEEVLGEEEDVKEDEAARMRHARHALRVHFSLWITGGVAIIAALYVGMHKNRWDMPVPLPAFQILSSITWAILSSILLQLLSLHRGLALLKGGTGTAYIARSFPIYAFLVALFPLYFLLYAGNGKIVSIPYLIVFTLPTNIIFILLILRYYRAAKKLLGDNARIIFHPDAASAARRAFYVFVGIFVFICVVFLDYARHKRNLWSYAARGNHIMLFRTLSLTGVDLDSRDEYGFSPLFWAIQGGADDFAKYAIENGGSVESLNDFGQTPLIHAVLENHISIVRMLVEKGADVNRPDSKEGQSPLILAAREGRKEILIYLLDKQANPNHKNNRGLTARALALENGHIEIADILLKHGAR